MIINNDIKQHMITQIETYLYTSKESHDTKIIKKVINKVSKRKKAK